MKKLCLFLILITCLAISPLVYAQNFATAVSQEETEATAEDTAAESYNVEEEIKDAKKEAEAAKAEAEAAAQEAAKAKREAEVQFQAAEMEKQHLLTEVKETEASKQRAEMLKKTANNKTDLKEALEKAEKEKMEDKLVEEKAKTTQAKMLAAQEKAALAEEKLKLAQAKLTAASAKIKEAAARRGLLPKLTESATVVLIGFVLFLILKIGIKRFEKAITKKDVIRESETTLRIKTVAKLFNWMGTILIIGVVFYIVAEKHGLNLAPLVAGAGIAGLAFGFGGQYLIRDLINGLFVLIEGQYRVNDVVKINEYGGLVEDINLRITTLRDLEGRVIIVPNGEVKTVVNYTREYAQALLDIGVAYKENVDHVMDVIKEIVQEMRKDKYFGRLILGDVEMFGVDDFADSQVTIKFRVKTLPIKQWEVMRELRRRIKNRFDELGIEIPFPHRTVYWGTGKDNEWVKHFADRITADKKK